MLADLLPNAGIDPEPWSLGVELVMGTIALFLAAADRVDARTRAAWRNRAIAAFLGFLGAGVAAEAGTRWVFRDITTSADSGSFFSRDWARGSVLLNPEGFRERSVTMPKPDGTYRIAAIGDSFTFGTGLEPRQRYSDLMNAWLPDRFEVVNFGVPGDNTPNHLDTLRNHALPAQADFVLLQWFINDIEGLDLSARPQTWRLAPYPPLHRWLNRHSALYVVANMRCSEIQIAMGLAPSYADYLQARAGDPGSPDAQREAGLLRRIIDSGRRQGVGTGIVLFPDTGLPLDSRYPFAYLHDRVLAVCAEQGITCLDLRKDFARVHDRRSLWVSPFDHHPSAKANAIAAAEIIATFQRDWSR